ncbi:LysR family transcriptional regulator [Burkholderia plantarii]|uniref:LysR family transcriptional regulator n=1 Tax=Burkholderia plantarii TaxID=41899 RepID=UPI0018DC09B4|nr:LysR family transcriptional regulator [Burkholderia plantarii]MBI0331102.1 LysR family transcriptional regulator [Burkholderia plantarii]
MNLKFLETFIWVAKLRSFSLAAEKLHSTQAAISSRISVLEQELGARLFKREPKGVTLTREGERVLRHAEQVSRSMTQLYESLQGETFAYGTIRIGAMDSAIHSWFVDFVTDVMEHYPNLDIEVTSDTALNLNEQLRRGMLDMVIQTDMLRDESIRSIGVLELAVVWIAAAGSPVSGRLPEDTATAALRRLCGERLITYSRHSRPHQDVLRLMQSHGINEARVSCVNSLAAMIRLTRAGFGVAAMPPALVQDLLEQGTLRRLEGLEVPPPLPFTIAWRTGSEWTERLVEIAVETVRGYAARLGEAAARVIV